MFGYCISSEKSLARTRLNRKFSRFPFWHDPELLSEEDIEEVEDVSSLFWWSFFPLGESMLLVALLLAPAASSYYWTCFVRSMTSCTAEKLNDSSTYTSPFFFFFLPIVGGCEHDELNLLIAGNRLIDRLIIIFLDNSFDLSKATQSLHRQTSIVSCALQSPDCLKMSNAKFEKICSGIRFAFDCHSFPSLPSTVGYNSVRIQYICAFPLFSSDKRCSQWKKNLPIFYLSWKSTK